MKWILLILESLEGLIKISKQAKKRFR